MISVEALPAAHGDCLWVEWDDGPHRRRMLIDGGPGGTRDLPAALAARFRQQPEDQREFDLVVCSHIDDDHIVGLLPLLTAPPKNFLAREIWFNSFEHTGPADTLGVRSAERLAEVLRERRLPWNTATGGGPIVVPGQERLPVFRLRGLSLTLLSPWPEQLSRLRTDWRGKAAARPERDVLRAPAAPTAFDARHLAELAARPYRADRAPANGSSIAFLAEHPDGSRVLFAADAHADVLVRSLRRLWHGNGYPVSLVKAPHHGSAHNVSAGLVAAIECRDWLFSTDGGRGHARRTRAGRSTHPAPEAVARILLRNAAGEDRPREPHTTLWFNHSTPSTRRYAHPSLAALGVRTEYPQTGTGGITVVVSQGSVLRGDRPAP
ncbi:ComEC/Rec2 family competence protein [Streptomyces sp. NPDC017179]|uniref:ComEC/Rec2 family competence protein n=1 Tax=Streptomyces sp. NPDC017179 TaxID=3364979 RepID=UPI003788CA93